jgi:1,4-alpha-glucan branching enzyme
MSRTRRATKEQQFSFRAPGALSVQLVGDFTHWQKQPVHLKKESEGIWRTTVSLEPGTYRYRFVVDGQWHDDPECTLRVPNPFGSEDMIREVPSENQKKLGATARIVPANRVQESKIEYQYALR